MRPHVPLLLRCPCLPRLGRVVLFYHRSYPAGAAQSLKEAIVLFVFQRLPVKVSLREVRQQSNLGIGSIGSAAQEIIDPENIIGLVLGGEISSGNLHSFLDRSD